MAKIEQLSREIVDAMHNKRTEPTPYDSKGVVRSVSDGVAYVHIYGGIDETPVQLTVDASVGDEVLVRVSGGRAYLVGNSTAPPTDNTYAKQVRAALSERIESTNSDVQMAQENIETVSQIAGNTNQYFWHVESGEDTGTHITEIPQEDFLADPDNGGGNLLARSNGIALRNGRTELASLSQTGMDVNTYKPNGDTVNICHLGYGLATATSGTANQPYYSIGYRYPAGDAFAYDPEERYSVGDHAVYDGMLYICIYNITNPEAWNADHWQLATGGYSVAEGYYNDASGVDSHAEGANTQAIGLWSHAEGFGAVALGDGSHAEGTGKAYGNYSHAEGTSTEATADQSHASGSGTVSDQEYQFAVGKYNTRNNTNNLFVVGKGTNNSNRSDAFTVDTSGNVSAAGALRAKTETASSPQGVYISSTVGTFEHVDIARFGNVVQMTLQFKNTASVASGSNVFEGNLATSQFQPIYTARGVAYYGAHALIMSVNGSGDIVIRNASSTAVTCSSTTYISAVWIISGN